MSIDIHFRENFSESPSTLLEFQEDLKRRRCVIGDQSLPTFMKPFFLPKSHLAGIQRQTEILVQGLETISERRFQSDELNTLLPIPSEIERLSRIHPGYSSHQPVLRLDTIYDLFTGEFQLLEFNCGDPSGMGWNDHLIQSLQSLESVRRLGESYDIEWSSLAPHWLDLLEKKYHEYCQNRGQSVQDNPTLALVCQGDSFVTEDFAGLQQASAERGWRSFICDPADLELSDNGSLVYRGEVIDIVYRDLVDDFLSGSRRELCGPFLQAIERASVCLLNPISSAAGDFKNILTLMSDDTYAGLFSDEQCEVFAKCVPWTRPYSETYYDMSLRLKDRLVLKPNDGFGGDGILIGRETSREDWDRVLRSPQASNYVLQQYVSIPRYEFPVWKGNQSEFCDQKVNLNFWAIDGKYVGAFARASMDSVINVCNGGGMVPVAYY